MTLWLPQLDLATSPLLRAAMDEHFFRIWDYERDGPYPAHRAVKDEIEAHVQSIEASNSAETLLKAANQDRSFMQGSSFRGPVPYTRREGTRPVAFRQLEIAVARRRWALNTAALAPPSRTDRVCLEVPGLFDALSGRDGLLSVTPQMIPPERSDDPFLLFGDHAIFIHPEIRGARELARDLWWLTANATDVRVAIDPHRVVPREDAQRVVLLDYWFGIRPTRADLDDVRQTGHTRHERRADQQESFGLYPLVATDFWWQAEGSTKILKVEETVPRSAFERSGHVINRFLHTIRDTAEKRFIHVDGAVKSFPLASYAADSAWPAGPKGECAHYRKMWRVEGSVDDSDWGRLVGHFFRGNELVIEYFGEMLDERAVPG